MRKILVLSVMALLGMMPAVGQHFFLKLEGGITSLYNADVRRLGTFGVGAGYEYEFDQKWSVSPAIMYVAKGWKEKTAIVPARDDDGNFVYDSETGEQVFGKKGVKSYANYIQVPVCSTITFVWSHPITFPCRPARMQHTALPARPRPTAIPIARARNGCIMSRIRLETWGRIVLIWVLCFPWVMSITVISISA